MEASQLQAILISTTESYAQQTEVLRAQFQRNSALQYIPIFRGNPLRFSAWRRELEKCFHILSADDRTKVEIALQTCGGLVSTFLLDFVNKDQNAKWEVVLRQLLLRFSDVPDQNTALVMLRKMSQYRHETLQMFAERLHHNLQYAFPDVQSTDPLVQREAIGVFIAGLTDSKIAHKLIRMAPASLVIAVEAAGTESNVLKRLDYFRANMGFTDPRSSSDHWANNANDDRYEESMEIDMFDTRSRDRRGFSGEQPGRAPQFRLNRRSARNVVVRGDDFPDNREQGRGVRYSGARQNRSPRGRNRGRNNYSNQGRDNWSRPQSQGGSQRERPFCSYCRNEGHVFETCYRRNSAMRRAHSVEPSQESRNDNFRNQRGSPPDYPRGSGRNFQGRNRSSGAAIPRQRTNTPSNRVNQVGIDPPTCENTETESMGMR